MCLNSVYVWLLPAHSLSHANVHSTNLPGTSWISPALAPFSVDCKAAVYKVSVCGKYILAHGNFLCDMKEAFFKNGRVCRMYLNSYSFGLEACYICMLLWAAWKKTKMICRLSFVGQCMYAHFWLRSTVKKKCVSFSCLWCIEALLGSEIWSLMECLMFCTPLLFLMSNTCT